MIKLNDRVWKSFRLGDLFEITLARPFFLDKTLDQTDISGTPYITRSSFNNGLVNRLNLETIDNSLKLINAGDCLTVGAEGKKAFYQNNDFIAGNKVTILRNRNISKPNYFFIIVALDMAMKDVFSYGRAATYGRLIDLNINLPSKDSEPDWQFMEDYIKQFEETKLLEIQETDYKDNVTLPSVDEWGSFRLDELFTLKKGFYGKKPNNDNVVCKRNIPLVSTSSSNNGILNKYTSDDIYNYDYFGKLNYSTECKIINGGVMTIASDGSVGSTFYQEVPFSSTHIVIICDPLFEINKYIGLFIKIITEKEKFRFGYGRKWALSRMGQSVIKLPALENGEPDWILIDRYMRSLPYSEMI